MDLLMTVLVYAGSAQLATTPMLAAGAPLPVIWATSLVVNLRFVIFSAASRRAFARLPWYQKLLAGYLNGDLGFAIFSQRFAGATEHGNPEQWGFFYGLALGNWASWQVGSVVGILLGNFVPTEWGLGLASYLALLAVLIPMLRTRPAAAGTLVATGVAVTTTHLPLRTGLLLAVVAGVGVALLVEHWAERRAALRPNPTEVAA